MRKPSILLEYLPAIYQSDPFIGQYLLAFEKVLLGINDHVSVKNLEKGLEETIADIAIYFDPQQTPENFLSWLSSWVALSLRADLSEQQQRQFIANMIQLYRKRGTKDNLKTILQIFIQGEPEIIETANAEFQVGVSTLGKTTYIGGGFPHFFKVNIILPDGLNIEQRRRKEAIARFVIDLEKPAHTQYNLNIIAVGTLTVGKSKVGVDTILGKISPSNP
jgi:phage tail-like protein